MARSVLSVLPALTALAVFAGLATAQPPTTRGPGPAKPTSQSRGPEGAIDLPPGFLRPGEELVPDFRLWLRGLNKKQLPKDVDPKLLQELMKKLPEDQRANKKDIEQLLEQNPQFKDPAFLKQLGEMVQSDDFPKNLEEKLPKDGPPIPNEQPLKENLEKVVEEGIKHAKAPEGGPKGDQPDLPKVNSSTFDLSKHGPKAANPASENDWAKWLEKNFSDSPAGQAALKDLMSALEKQDMKGMFDQVPEFKNGAWKDLDTWGKSNAPDLWKVKPPDLSGNKVTSPKIGGSGGPSWGGGGGGGGSSGFGGGGGTDLSGGGTALAVIVGIAGAVLLAVLLLRQWKLKQAERAAAHLAGRPGIDFDSIRTREELVQAFDHVSLDQIGEEARSWNHRVIADQFAGARPAQAEPADELAGLYERARYAPLDEDLTTGEFADARRDLRAIAGVPA
jgi:hypothetical protein